MPKKLYLTLGILLPIIGIYFIYNSGVFYFEWYGTIIAFAVAVMFVGLGLIFTLSKLTKTVTLKWKNLLLYFFLPYILVYILAWLLLMWTLIHMFSANDF